MSWNELGKTVAQFAPLLGAALPVPGGAAIGTLIASVFGGNADDPESLNRAIQTNPEAAVKLRQIETEHKTELERIAMQRVANQLAADTARIESVNQTMQAETKSQGLPAFWQPFWGIVSAVAFFIQATSISYLLMFKPEQATTAIAALGSLSMFWSVPLAILGVSAYHRGVEKRITAGEKLNSKMTLFKNIIGR